MSSSDRFFLAKNPKEHRTDVEPNEFGKYVDSDPSLSHRGSCLLNEDLLPNLLRSNMRAGLFPEERMKILNTIRNGLVRVASRDILEIEKTNYSCKDIRLTKVEDISYQYVALPHFLANQTLFAQYYTKFFESVYGNNLIGCEKWTINRCGAEQTYKVNFFKDDGDSFYAKIAVTDITSLKNKLVYLVKKSLE